MRLSEAIRLGAMLKPQGRGWLLDDQGGSCGLGAALDAIGKLTRDSDGPGVRAVWPMLSSARPFPAPCGCHCKSRDMFEVATHINDDHGWTREQIADWVESIENAHAAKDREAGAVGSVSTANDAEILITLPK